MLPQNKLNKKALSEVVSYVFLIIIALALAAMTYSFLKVYIPKEKIECPSDISLIIDSYACRYIYRSGGGIGQPATYSSYLNISFINKGLFKIDAAYIRIGAPGTKAKAQLNKAKFNLFSFAGTQGLNPGEVSASTTYSLVDIIQQAGAYELEIEPALIEGATPTACSNAIITQVINCTAE